MRREGVKIKVGPSWLRSSFHDFCEPVTYRTEPCFQERANDAVTIVYGLLCPHGQPCSEHRTGPISSDAASLQGDGGQGTAVGGERFQGSDCCLCCVVLSK